MPTYAETFTGKTGRLVDQAGWYNPYAANASRADVSETLTIVDGFVTKTSDTGDTSGSGDGDTPILRDIPVPSTSVVIEFSPGADGEQVYAIGFKNGQFIQVAHRGGNQVVLTRRGFGNGGNLGDTFADAKRRWRIVLNASAGTIQFRDMGDASLDTGVLTINPAGGSNPLPLDGMLFGILPQHGNGIATNQKLLDYIRIFDGDMSTATPADPAPAPSPTPSPTPTPPAAKSNTVGTKPIFVQEDAAGGKTLLFTATATGGGTPARARYRLRSDRTPDQVFRDWSYAGSDSASGSTATGQVSLPSSRTRDESWIVDFGIEYSDGTTSFASSNRIAVGVVPLIPWGQSNATLRRIPATGAGHPAGVYAWGRTNPNSAEGSWRGPNDTDEKPTLVVLAADIAARLNKPVGIFWAGQSASGIGAFFRPDGFAWKGDGIDGNDDDAAMLEMIALTGCRPGAAIWDQWEGQVFGSPQITNYPQSFTTMANGLRTEFGDSNFPILIALAGRLTSGDAPSAAVVQQMRETQLAIVDNARNVVIGSSALGAQMHADGIHYTVSGYQTKMRREALTFARLRGQIDYDGRGPLPASASLDGSTVRIALTMNGATGLSGSALTGYETSTADSGESGWTAVPANDASIVGNELRLANRTGAKWVRSFYGVAYDESSLATGTGYPDDLTIPVFPIVSPMTVSSSSTPAPSPTPSPAPTPTPTPTPTPPASGRGAITASAARTARFSETQDASPRGAGVPAGAVIISAPMDPHTKRDFAFDFSSVLGTSELAELTKIVVNPIGFLDGFRIMANPAPFLNAEGRIGQVRAEVLSNRQDDEIYFGSGTQADVTVGGRLTDGQTVEATFIVPLRNL